MTPEKRLAKDGKEAAPPVQTSAPLQMEVALTAIQPGLPNPRKDFNPEKLEELAASIKKDGVLQPVLLRPHPDNKGYQLVAGERRCRAAKAAGLKTVPAIIKPLTDDQVREAMMIENLHRADLSAIEEAREYRSLIDEHSHTPETIAARLNKSVSHVYSKLKLTNLPETAIKSLESGEISESTAVLIGRLPAPAMRAVAAEEICERKAWVYDDATSKNVQQLSPMSFREAKAYVSRKFMVQLKGAPFSRDDAALVPSAGACKTCPKMAGNNRAEYPEGRDDLCTDPECYNSKVRASKYREIKKVEDQGIKVLPKSEGMFYGGGYLKGGSPYVDLKDPCPYDGAGRTWKKILGDSIYAESVAAVDGEGNVHRLHPVTDAKRILKGLGIKGVDDGGHKSVKTKDQQQKDREVEKATDLKICLSIRAAMSKRATLSREPFNEAISVLIEGTNYLGEETICQANGILLPKSEEGASHLDLILKALSKKPVTESFIVMAQAVALDRLSSAGERLLKEMKLDRKQIEQRVRGELKAAAQKDKAQPQAKKPAVKPRAKKAVKKAAPKGKKR